MNRSHSLLGGIPLALMVAVVFCWTAGDASAARYRGGGDGLKVEIRVKGHRIVYARLAGILYCTEGSRGRHLRRFRAYYGTPNLPNDATEVDTRPISIGADGRFSVHHQASTSEGTQERAFAGKVRSGAIKGFYRASFSYSYECQTGGYPRPGRGSPEKLNFRASRR